MFKVDYDKVGGEIQPGTYEVVVTKAYETETKAGRKHIKLYLTVRNDVNQSHKNQNIFHDIWTKKEDNTTYTPASLNIVCKGLSIPNGTNFKTIDDVLNALNKKIAKVTVKSEESNGYTNLRITKWEPSAFPQVAHVFKDDLPEGFLAVNNEDIPF